MSDNSPSRRAADTKPLAARLVDGVCLLALGAWFGAIVMLAITAAATFKTVRHHQPTLHVAPFDQPHFQERAVPILAGAIVGKSISGLAVVQVICAGLALACIALQVTVWRRHLVGGVAGGWNVLRLALVALPVAVLAVNLAYVTPGIVQQRDVMWDASLTQAQRDDAAARFQGLHKLSERSVGLAALSLAGAVVVSSLALGGVARREDDAPLADRPSEAI